MLAKFPLICQNIGKLYRCFFKEESMQAFTAEESILEGEKEVKEPFGFVRKNAADLEAYKMEQAIFSRVMQIGLAAMKCYFAEKGTGDVGNELILEDGNVLKKEDRFRGWDYFSCFGKLKVPRTYYRLKGKTGVMPLDEKANLPERCYSYLLQEWMDLFSIRDSFKESGVS